MNDNSKPTLDKWSNWRCGHCGKILIGKPDACPWCGKGVKWMEDKDESLETPAAYPADLMEHRYSGLISED